MVEFDVSCVDGDIVKSIVGWVVGDKDENVDVAGFDDSSIEGDAVEVNTG